MKITTCQFAKAVHRPEEAPRSADPDVIFVGRSNVGKSSLINRLLGVRSLARTSSAPGRTRSINVYRINERFHFVDLPGYGYAEVSKEIRGGWGPLVEGFLDRRRPCVAQAVLVVDARHGGIDSDLVMRDWLAAGGVAYLVAATKADKLRGGARVASLRALSDALGPDSSGAEPILVSAVTGTGVRDVWARLDAALTRHAGIARGRAWTSRR